MSDGDLEARVRDLERFTVRLGQKVLDQQDEITRLRTELDHELTQRVIQSLTPWPTKRVVTLESLLAESGPD